MVPERREAWVGEGLECSGEEVDEGGRYKDTGAEVSRNEEELVRHGDAREAFDDDWKGAGYRRQFFPNNVSTAYCDVPAVLRASIKTSAKTCMGVLYLPWLPFVPQVGRSSSCRRRSSERRMSVGMSAQERPRRVP